jgi:hypothetical protein
MGTLGLLHWRDAMASRHWPRVPGRILETRVTRYRRRRRWDWIVRYRYQVEGRSFESSRVYFGAMVPIGIARNIVARFPAGTDALVAYDPVRPGKGVLLAGPNKYTWLGLMSAPVLWLVAGALWYGPGVT